MLHSFLLIGQSNAAGRGELDKAAPIENPHLLMLRNGRWQPMHAPVNYDRPFAGYGLIETFVDSYQKDHGVDVGIIPCADGGTHINQWQKGGLLYDHAVFMARLAERTSTIAGVIWHQGETNCSPVLFPGYEAKFEKFYADLCADLHLENIPFVMGGLGDFLVNVTKYSEYAPQFNPMIERIAAKYPMMGFVSAEGLPGKPDNLHFNAEAVREFGYRYYEVFKTLEPKDRVFTEKPRLDLLDRSELDAL